RAGEEAERAAARHVGAANDDLGDLLLTIEIGGIGGRQPSLAGAGRAEDHNLRAGTEGVEIVGVGSIERLDRRQGTFAVEFVILEGDDLSRLHLTAGTTLIPAQAL